MKGRASLKFDLPLKKKTIWRFWQSFIGFKGTVSIFLILLLFLVTVNPSPIFASHTRVWLNGHWDQPKAITAIAGKPVTAYVMVSDVDDSDGLAAYEITITYDNRYLTIPDIDQNQIADVGYLDGLGIPGLWTTFIMNLFAVDFNDVRIPICSQGVVSTKQDNPNLSQISFSCATKGQNHPGATGSGVLASIKFETTKGNIGTIPLDITESILVDVTGDANPIIHSQTDGNLIIAKCADLNADGRVNIIDIGMIVAVFGSTPTSPNWNQAADLNGDNYVNVLDISIVVGQFGQQCP